jgi:hypothetical protein
MTEAPGSVDAAQLRELHIRLREIEKRRAATETPPSAARPESREDRAMAGHSKWANIKHRKAAQDAKRGKMFTKLIRELVVAAQAGRPAARGQPAPARRRGQGAGRQHDPRYDRSRHRPRCRQQR